MTGPTLTQNFIPPHKRVNRTNGAQPDHAQQPNKPVDEHTSKPVASKKVIAIKEDTRPSHIAQKKVPASQAQPKTTLPPRGRRTKWTKNSDLKDDRWMTDHYKSQLKDQNEKLDPIGDWANTDAPTWNNGPLKSFNGVPIIDANDGVYELLNYDGTWAPPPDDWSERPPFANVEQRAKNLQAWLEAIVYVENPLGNVTKLPHSSNFNQSIPTKAGTPTRYYFSCPSDKENAMGEIAPVSWIPQPIDARTSLRELWSDHLKEPPTPSDPEDLQDVKPWWDLYPSPVACFQMPLQHPENRGVDVTDESTTEARMRKLDKGSAHHISRWNQGYRPKQDRGGGRGGGRGGRGRGGRGHYNDRIKHDSVEGWAAVKPSISKDDPVDEWPAVQTSVSKDLDPYIPPDPTLHPKVNIYLRNAQTSDMAQITRIYNHYVSKTVRVPEVNPVVANHMLDRLRSINTVSHTFIVACLASRPATNLTSKGPGGRNKNYPLTPTDRIIGFASTDDFAGPTSMYRFVAELEVYTDPEFTRRGVASCLVDKILAVVDPAYVARGGYEIRDDDLRDGGVATRLVKCVWINFPIVAAQGDKEWAEEWLKGVGFERTGYHKNVAFKVGERFVFPGFILSSSLYLDMVC